MSMTKQQFFDELTQNLAPTEAEIEAQYYWEVERRRQMWIDQVVNDIKELPDSHWFSPHFEKWMRTKEHYETERKVFAELMARRKASNPTTDMDFDIPIDVEDSNHQKRNEELDNLFF